MAVIVALLPALILIGGAILHWTPLPLPVRHRNFTPLLANALALAALLYLARTTTQPLLVFEPSDAIPALGITLQWTGAVVPLGILVLLVVSGRVLLGIGDDVPAFSAGALVVEAGALLFLAADNWNTVTAAWLIVEFGLLIVPDDELLGGERAAQAFGWNLAAIVAWLTAGMMLSNEGATLRLEETAAHGLPALLILLALWVRSGLYPFHAAAPAGMNSAGVRLGIPLLLGGYLMTRLLATTDGAMSYATEMKVITLVALGLCSILVIAQPKGPDALVWVVRAAAAPLLLLPFFISPAGAPAVAVWLAGGLFVVCNVVGVAWLWRAQLQGIPFATIMWVAALVASAMLPLAPAFWSRANLLEGAYAQGIALWLALTATQSLILTPLWRELFASRETAPTGISRIEIGVLGLVLLPTLAIAVAPTLITNFLGGAIQQSGMIAYDAVFKPASVAVLAFLLAGLIVPVIASFELARRWGPRATFVPGTVTGVLDLSSIGNTLDWVYRFVRAVVQQGMALLEQPPIAWLIFLAIWVAVWLRGLGT